MTVVSVALTATTETRIREKASEAGLTLEAYLGQLAEKDAAKGERDKNLAADDQEEDDERPWRGLFAPGRPRELLFSRPIGLDAGKLPKREPAVSMNWHRAVSDDE